MDYRLDTLALVVSQHYRLLKTVVSGSRTFRLLTPDEARRADYFTDVIEAVAGKNLAAYCRERFRQGWMTRDLRSYKIRFVFPKLRDMLKDCPAKQELLARMRDLTKLAEALAGSELPSSGVQPVTRKKSTEDSPEQMDLFEEAQKRALQTAKPTPATPDDGEVEDLLDDCDLIVRPSVLLRVSGTQTEDEDINEEPSTPEAMPDKPIRKKAVKRTRAEKKFDKLAQEILAAEYGPANGEDDEKTEDENNAEDNGDYGYDDAPGHTNWCARPERLD